jgi:hypothetical protein
MTFALLLVFAAAPDAGVDAGPDRAALALLSSAFGAPQREVTRLGDGGLYGATSITSVKAIEDYHWAGCGYELWLHALEVEVPDAGWTGFLGRSGSSGCPAEKWNDVDSAKLVAGTIRITSGVAKGPTHRAGKGAVLHLVPYQDFAVPRELGAIKPLPQKRCLELVERPGVFFETGGWCTPTKDAITCLAVRNRCDFAIDAEGHAFSFDGSDYVVQRGCVIPAKEHALVVGEYEGAPPALTFWTARCPTSERPTSR